MNEEQQRTDKPTLSKNEPQVCWVNPKQGLRAGMVCPRCKQAKIEYNGLLQLVCPNCGLAEAGACT